MKKNTKLNAVLLVFIALISMTFLGCNKDKVDDIMMGCTDENSINFNPQATENDGSCADFIVDDRDGKTYKVVKMGDQWWFLDDLDYGIIIGGCSLTDNNVAEKYDTNSSSGFYTIGELLQYSDEEQGLCPNGWHVPTDEEWMTLETFLGMPSDELFNFGERGINNALGNKFSNSDFKLKMNGFFQINNDDFCYRNATGVLGGYFASTKLWANGAKYILRGYNGEVLSGGNQVGISRTKIDEDQVTGYNCRCIKN